MLPSTVCTERLKPTRDFTVLRKNESTVQFKWDDIITPYMGEYLLSCSVEGSMTNPDLLQRLNSTSFLWNAPKSIEIYSCVLNVCWKGIFHGEMQEYCPTETKSFIRFNVSSLGAFYWILETFECDRLFILTYCIFYCFSDSTARFVTQLSSGLLAYLIFTYFSTGGFDVKLRKYYCDLFCLQNLRLWVKWISIRCLNKLIFFLHILD